MFSSLTLLSGTLSRAQLSTASLNGTVQDKTGALIIKVVQSGERLNHASVVDDAVNRSEMGEHLLGQSFYGASVGNINYESAECRPILQCQFRSVA
jgi:hypothetical protein